jgi:methylthioribose-1-phosphate isomerase
MPKTIELKKDHLVLIDQRLLPSRLKFIRINDYRQMIRAIYTMQIRGAQAIGAAGAGAAVLAAQSYQKNSLAGFEVFLLKAAKEIIAARPTAVNLAWAVDRVISAAQGQTVKERQTNAFRAAEQIFSSEVFNNIKIGIHGSRLIKNGSRILTHCNAGSLSGIWFGTATAPMYAAQLSGKKFKVNMDETRPMLQGARLTAWELSRAGIDCQLNIDSACGFLMSHGLIDMVIVGADRVAANGEVANKIGTYPLALMAHEHKVPFYVAAVISSIDFKIKSGRQIPIEQRDPEEITADIKYLNQPIAPAGIKAFNPVFDVTPAKYVTKIITERGIFSPAKIIGLK